MKSNLHLALPILMLTMSPAVMALVDYSDSAPSFSSNTSSSSAPTSTTVSTARAPKAKKASSSGTSGMFDMSTYYQSVKVESPQKTSKVNLTGLSGRLRPIDQAYLDFSFYAAKSDSTYLTQSTKTQKGNPIAKIGINWLDFGSIGDRATIDFYGGMMFGQEKSDFAATRDDKIFGLESTKTLGPVIIGLGYDLRMTGNPSTDVEVDIGNIQTLSATIAMVISHDISFQLDGKYVNVGASDKIDRNKYLSQKVSFGALSPRLHLAINPLFNLSLGADFRTKRASSDLTLEDARMWDMPYSMGNSIHLGLNIRI